MMIAKCSMTKSVAQQLDVPDERTMAEMGDLSSVVAIPTSLRVT